MFWKRLRKKKEVSFPGTCENNETDPIVSEDTGESAVEKLQEEMADGGKRLEALEKAIRRHSDSLEDLLDALDEKSRRESELEQEFRESRAREEALIRLAVFSREQMDLVLQRWGEEDAWNSQLKMMENDAVRYLRDAGLQETGRPGEPVDYEIHQVLEAVEPEQEEQAGTVARVYRRGRIYRGKVITKAQVAAYKLSGSSC